MAHKRLKNCFFFEKKLSVFGRVFCKSFLEEFFGEVFFYEQVWHEGRFPKRTPVKTVRAKIDTVVLKTTLEEGRKVKKS